MKLSRIGRLGRRLGWNTSVGVLKEIGAALLEVHGQHETVGLLDQRTHRGLMDAFGGLTGLLADTAETWRGWRKAQEAVDSLAAEAARAAAEAEDLAERLAELDRLEPRPGEEARLAEERAVLGAAERVGHPVAHPVTHPVAHRHTGRAADGPERRGGSGQRAVRLTARPEPDRHGRETGVRTAPDG